MRLVRFICTDDHDIFVNPENVVFIETAVRTGGIEGATRISCLECYEPYVWGTVEEVAEKLAGTTYLKANLTEAR